MSSTTTLNQRIYEIGSSLLDRARAAEPRFYHSAWWQQQLLNWMVRHDWFKTQSFRFVEVLPALQTDRDVLEHLRLYLCPQNGHAPPPLVNFAIRSAKPDTLRGKLASRAVRWSSQQMSHNFVAGSTAEEAIEVIKRMRTRNRAFTLDLLGESVTSDAQADRVTETYVHLITELGTAARTWKRIRPIDFDSRGPYPIVNMSVKLSALCAHFDPVAIDRTVRVVGDRLAEILRAARKYDAFVNVDIEQFKYKELTFAIFEHVMSQPEFADFPDAGIVIQAYLTSAEQDLDRIIQWNRKRRAPLAIRLVKGAYWDYESSLAGHAVSPVYLKKWQSDASFERCTTTMFDNVDHIRPAFGTHNIRSIACAIAEAESHDVPIHDYEIQMLYGMGEPLKAAVSQMGYFLRIYTPYGDMVPGMAYLIRRLLENTANESFLRQSFTEHQPAEVLLADPASHDGKHVVTSNPRSPHVGVQHKRDVTHAVRSPLQADDGEANTKSQTACSTTQEKRMSTFKNEPYTNFANNENREKLLGALRDWRSKLKKEYPLRIDGQSVTTQQWIESVNPANTSEIIGRVAKADTAHADQAARAARQAFDSWRMTPVQQRADLLCKAGEIMKKRRFELDALLVLEAGKTWLEADADVAEAIDFCLYYAEEAQNMFTIRTRNTAAENNLYFYEPRGVTLVVAPWNFPLAILCGMTAAALVTGNTVVMKPASVTPVIGATFMEIMEQAGVPDGVLNFLAGPGGTVGDHLLRHPDVNMVVFTGSREVGLGMIRAGADFPKGQNFIRKIVCELGGKNAVIVDSDADLDAAVEGVITSAFGYSGQKCSACSRAIVLEQVYDKFVSKLTEAGNSIVIGPPEDPATLVGPVIDESARKGIQQYIQTGTKEGRTVVERSVGELAQKGYFVTPTIIVDVDPQATIAQEEIFGPVLAVIKAKNFDHAVEIANGTSYALTGGLYSRNPDHLKRIKRELQVGNMYLNRKITGALVDLQPFGGFKMSGIGSKAGGPDYLIQFVEPRTVTENTVRTGIASKSDD